MSGKSKSNRILEDGITLTGIILIWFVWFLYDFGSPGNTGNADYMTGYWLFYALLMLLLTVVVWRLRYSVDAGTDSKLVAMLLVSSFAIRFAVVSMSSPVLSDDIWRYIHDGATLSHGVNPYLHAPADLSTDQQPIPQIIERINNPNLVTIYQPTSQVVFAGLDRVWSACPDFVKQWDPDHDKVFRLGFVLFDMLLIGVILAWLRDAGRSPWWAVAYAWHPLAISEVAGSGHQDPIGITCLATALWLAFRFMRTADEALSRKRLVLTVCAGIAFGLAVAVKPIVLPIALPLAWLLRRRPALVVTAASATVLTGLALYTPFVLMDGGLSGMLETGRTFIDTWAINGSLYPLFDNIIAGKPWVNRAAFITLLIVLITATLRERDNPARPAGVFLFASLLVSSTVHPWYLLWALALAPLWFSPSFWVFSLTVTASYAAHLQEGYRVPQWVVVCEYIPVYAVLAWELTKWMRHTPPFSGRACSPIPD